MSITVLYSRIEQYLGITQSQITVQQHHPLASFGELDGEVDRNRRFANAPLTASDTNYTHDNTSFPGERRPTRGWSVTQMLLPDPILS